MHRTVDADVPVRQRRTCIASAQTNERLSEEGEEETRRQGKTLLQQSLSRKLYAIVSFTCTRWRVNPKLFWKLLYSLNTTMKSGYTVTTQKLNKPLSQCSNSGNTKKCSCTFAQETLVNDFLPLPPGELILVEQNKDGARS